MATLSAASRRGGAGRPGGGGGVGVGGGNGNNCNYQQQFKMASVSEEESAGEPSAVAATTKRGGRRSCDARSDSGFSDCSSLTSSSAASAHVRSQPHHCSDGKSPSATAIAEETTAPGAAAAVPVPVSLDRLPRSVQPAPSHAVGTIAEGRVPAGTRGGGLCEASRMIFDSGGAGRPPDGRDGGGGGLRHVAKENARVQTAMGDNFKKTFAFWQK